MTRRTVGIVLFDEVEVLDFAGPFEVFSRTRLIAGLASRRSEDSAPFSVFTMTADGRTVTTTGGLQVTPRYSFAAAPHLDILVVPGGFGTRPLLDDAAMTMAIAGWARQAELVASVCTGALLLAKAGLLDGRRATTHWGSLDLLASLGPIDVVRDQRVVDAGVMTSAGVSAGIDLALAIVERLHGKGVADETAHYMEYVRQATR